MSRKLGFPLKTEEGWPPYDVEHIWVEESDGFYTVKSFPFFLKGIAYDDVLDAKVDSDGYVKSWHHVNRSGNSIIWIIENKPSKLVRDLISLGCGVEREPTHKIISVNVPSSVSLSQLDRVLRHYEDSNTINVAVPVDRIGLLKL